MHGMPQARLGTTQHACVYVWKTYLLVVLVLLTPHPEGGEHFDLSSSQDMSAKTHENRTQDTHNDALSHAHAQNIDGTQEAGICATRMPRRQTICAVCCHAAPVLCFCLFSEPLFAMMDPTRFNKQDLSWVKFDEVVV